MTEPEAELQATVILSPLSPSPVHPASPLVVPALQDTVDTIDAMVAAAAPEAAADFMALDSTLVPDAAVGNDGNPAVDDGGSENQLTGNKNTTAATSLSHPALEIIGGGNNNDAKTFNSSVESLEGVGQELQHPVSSSSSMPPDSNLVSLLSDQLKASLPSGAAPAAAAHDPTATTAADAGAAAAAAAAAQPGAPSSSVVPLVEPSQHPAGIQQPVGSPMVQSEPTAKPDFATLESQDSSAEIQQLVADLTSQAAESTFDPDPSASAATQAEPSAGSNGLAPSAALPSSSSLPPRPPPPHTGSQSYSSQHHAAGSSSNAPAPGAASAIPVTSQPSAYAAGAPGTSSETVGNLPPPPASGQNASSANMTAPAYPSQQVAPGYSGDGGGPDPDYQRQWDQFMVDERQYMSEAKWDRFPEGSRIFIGNLSSDKVSKRDVFDVFHKYGRLAQISLKSAYGFVQYHAVEEGRRAIENLQGVEIKGRRIHLEVSRAQEKSKKDRGRSPDKARGREGRRNDKHHQGRDDYRPGRNHSPRRNDHHSRDEGFGRANRGRSRSPGYGRNERDSYRRRSPSPYGRSRHEPEIDLPRRFGSDVPDVQIILQPDVNRDFVAWVENPFKAKGLKTEVMYLHPRIPKEQVIQRQAAEGVHGVVDLDLRAQSLGRIPIQAFDRSSGTSNIRYDQYIDLEPNTAAEVILRAKTSATATFGQGYGAAAGYANPYGGTHQAAAHHGAGGYAAAQHAAAGPYSRQHQQHTASATSPDIASLVGQVDNATLQRLLSSMQGASQTPGAMAGAPAGYGVGAPAAAANPQVDIQAILDSLGSNSSAQQHALSQGQYGAAYGAQPPTAANGSTGATPGGSGGDAAAQVQNIMAQLARYRQ